MSRSYVCRMQIVAEILRNVKYPYRNTKSYIDVVLLWRGRSTVKMYTSKGHDEKAAFVLRFLRLISEAKH